MRERVRRHMERFERRALPLEGRRPAAVAAALLEHAGETCFVLTRRSAHLPRHAGQWSLPGGRRDHGETPMDAALRELEEEVGIRAAPDDIMGLLDDFPTRSGFVITPVVVWAGTEPHLEPDPNEVAAAYRVPLSALEHPEIPRLRTIPESEHPVLSIPLPAVDTEVFTPTAAILYQLREVALHGRPTRVAHYEAPLFAWR